MNKVYQNRGVGYLTLFLGGLFGITIGIILVLIDRNSFPDLDSRPLASTAASKLPTIYVGKINQDSRKKILIFQIDADKPNRLTSILVDDKEIKTVEHQLSAYKSWLSFYSAFNPIAIEFEKNKFSLVGRRRINGSYSGDLLDANRNSKGTWTANRANEVENAWIEINPQYLEQLNMHIDSREHDMLMDAAVKKKNLLEKETTKAQSLLNNASSLSAEVDAKLKNAKSSRDISSKEVKASKANLDRLRNQIIITQKVSPPAKFYLESLESLRLESSWFKNALLEAKKKDAI